jgi:adenylate cyclase
MTSGRSAIACADCANDVIDPVIAKHGGKVVQTDGDSLLIVFDGIEGAVRCAVGVRKQRESAAHNESHAADRGIRFRIPGSTSATQVGRRHRSARRATA